MSEFAAEPPTIETLADVKVSRQLRELLRHAHPEC